MATPAIPLKEFDVEMASTRKLLERVPGDKGAWKPHEKSFSLGHLAQLVVMDAGMDCDVAARAGRSISRRAPATASNPTDDAARRCSTRTCGDAREALESGDGRGAGRAMVAQARRDACCSRCRAEKWCGST